MATQEVISLADRAKAIYDEKLRSRLELSNRHEFVAVEPDSGDFFLGKTLSEAIQAARAVYPDRLPFVLHVGHKTTVEIGVIS